MSLNILKKIIGTSLIGLSGFIISTSAQAGVISLGDGAHSNGGPDSWRAIMVINDEDLYTNVSGATEYITVDSFNMHVARVTGQVTPFVVKVNNAATNDFTIMAIGDTRYAGNDYNSAGFYSYDFSSFFTEFELGIGESIASAFLDATVDGISNGAVINFSGGNNVFLTGSSSDGGSGNLSNGVGGAPTFGSNTFQGGLGRTYAYDIGATVNTSSARIPEPAALGLLGLGLVGIGAMRRRRR